MCVQCVVFTLFIQYWSHSFGFDCLKLTHKNDDRVDFVFRTLVCPNPISNCFFYFFMDINVRLYSKMKPIASALTRNNIKCRLRTVVW